MMGRLIEDLITATLKLYNLCNEKALAAKNPADFTKEEMAAIMGRDIELCKQRASLKKQIEFTLDAAIKKGSLDIVDEVKNYG